MRFGDADTDDLAALTAYLRERKRAAEDEGLSTRFYGRIKVGTEVPLGGAFDVLETFVAAEVPHVNTAETFLAIPPRALREAKRLPYPEVPRRKPTKQVPRPKDLDTAD